MYKLPEFFRNGLYSLIRAGLPDSEIIHAFMRCRTWTRNAKRNRYGECECCGTRLPMNRVNAQGVISERFTSEADAKRLKREILMAYPAATVRIEKTDESGRAK